MTEVTKPEPSLATGGVDLSATLHNSEGGEAKGTPFSLTGAIEFKIPEAPLVLDWKGENKFGDSYTNSIGASLDLPIKSLKGNLLLGGGIDQTEKQDASSVDYKLKAEYRYFSDGTGDVLGLPTAKVAVSTAGFNAVDVAGVINARPHLQLYWSSALAYAVQQGAPEGGFGTSEDNLHTVTPGMGFYYNFNKDNPDLATNVLQINASYSAQWDEIEDNGDGAADTHNASVGLTWQTGFPGQKLGADGDGEEFKKIVKPNGKKLPLSLGVSWTHRSASYLGDWGYNIPETGEFVSVAPDPTIDSCNDDLMLPPDMMSGAGENRTACYQRAENPSQDTLTLSGELRLALGDLFRGSPELIRDTSVVLGAKYSVGLEGEGSITDHMGLVVDAALSWQF